MKVLDTAWNERMWHFGKASSSFAFIFKQSLNVWVTSKWNPRAELAEEATVAGIVQKNKQNFFFFFMLTKFSSGSLTSESQMKHVFFFSIWVEWKPDNSQPPVETVPLTATAQVLLIIFSSCGITCCCFVWIVNIAVRMWHMKWIMTLHCQKCSSPQSTVLMFSQWVKLWR